MAGLILAGIVTAAMVAAVIGFSADAQPCGGSHSECGEYGGIIVGMWAFLLSVPICSAVYIWLANRSLAKARRNYEAALANPLDD